MCTGIRTLVKGNKLLDRTKNAFFARTMEFGVDLESRITVKLAGPEQTADINGKPGLTWPTKFNY